MKIQANLEVICHWKLYKKANRSCANGSESLLQSPQQRICPHCFLWSIHMCITWWKVSISSLAVRRRTVMLYTLIWSRSIRKHSTASTLFGSVDWSRETSWELPQRYAVFVWRAGPPQTRTDLGLRWQGCSRSGFRAGARAHFKYAMARTEHFNTVCLPALWFCTVQSCRRAKS